MLFNMRVKAEWLEKVREFAKSKGLTVSALVKVAVEYYMKREG